jgi:DNA-binding NarL/FixJ family response regulator
MKILIVDDSKPVRQSLKKIFSELDQVQIVGEAETAATAFEMVAASKPEVIILDIALKEGSGFEVLEKTKAQEHPPVVVILTNYASPPFRKKAQYVERHHQWQNIIAAYEKELRRQIKSQ